MGQLLSSEEEFCQAKDAIGSLLYDAMLEGGALPDLRVVHPLLLANQDERLDTGARLQEQLLQLQSTIGNKAPTYLRDLIGRLSTFSDEPRLAGLVGLVVTMVMDMVYTSSRQSSSGRGNSAGSSSSQRVWKLQEVMEEYLKRCRINLSDKGKLIQDSIRLEAQLSLVLTQLKTCLLGGDCDSRSLRHWASGAAFHTQMLVHLAGLEDKEEPLSAKAVLEQYKEDLTQIIPAYRLFKFNTICVVKCRGDLLPSFVPSTETPEEGSMTGLTVTDREMGKSVAIPLSTMVNKTGRRGASGPATTSVAVPPSIKLDLVTSDQYAQAYLDHFFSDKGPVAELQNYFIKSSDGLRKLSTHPGCESKMGVRQQSEPCNGVHLKGRAEGASGEQRADVGKDDKPGKTESRRRQEKTEEGEQRDENLKLSIVESQHDHNLHSASST